jgi:hypothetical protein
VVAYLADNNVLSSSQFGFTKGKTTTLEIINFLAFIITTLEKGDAVDAIYLDLRKAFDTVPLSRLVAKVESYGIIGLALKWISAFLFNRSQFVTIGNCRSGTAEVLSGVPQGSVLGPLLFLLFIDDLDAFCSCFVGKFADDTRLARRISARQPILDADSFQNDLNSVNNWAEENEMTFSAPKCEVVHFGYNNPRSYYSLNNNLLSAVSNVSDLGVTICDNLKAGSHCINIVRSANKHLHAIRRSLSPLDKPSFLVLYKSLVRSRLENGSPAWNPYLQKDIKLLESVQRRATKLVVGIGHLSYEDRLRFLGLQTLETRRARQDLITVFKLLKGLFVFDWTILFELDKNTRTRGHCFKLRRKTTPTRDYARYFFNYRVIETWNSLPEPVVTAPTLGRFKRLLHASGVLGEL